MKHTCPNRFKHTRSACLIKLLLPVTTLLLLSTWFSACASSSAAKLGTAITRFPLIPPEDQQNAWGQTAAEPVATLLIPFDKTWQIYPDGSEQGRGYQEAMARLKSRLQEGSHLLFSGATESGEFDFQTRYIINKRLDVSLKDHISFLMHNDYGHVESAKDLGLVETEGGIEGRLLQYLAKGIGYFELIYQVEDFFLRSIISTRLSLHQDEAKLDVAKSYMLNLLRRISVESTHNAQKTKGS